MGRRALLVCGILSSLLYVAMTAFVPTQWQGYSSVSQTVSELSAIGDPIRPLWVVLALPYTLLVAAFGWGVWRAAGGNRPLRVVGALLVAQGVIGLAWPPVPQREVLASGGADTMHIVFTMITVALMLLAMGFGAAAFGIRFRRYTFVSMGLLVAFGGLTGWDAPRIQANLPTRWLGVWERVNVGMFMLWAAVLATTLLRARDAAASDAGVAEARQRRRE